MLRADLAVTRLAKMSGFPNGLAFLPDGSLVVGCSLEHRLVRFAWHGDAVGPAEEWVRFDDRFGPDGMVVDGDTLIVTGSVGDRVAVLDLAGRLLRMIDTGEGSDPTNCCVQDRTLWVTLGIPGQLISLDL